MSRGSARQAHTENFWMRIETELSGTLKAEAGGGVPGQGSREEAEEDEASTRRRRRPAGSDDGADGRRRDRVEPESGQRRWSEGGQQEGKSLCGSSRGLRARARSPSCIGHSTFHFSRKKTVLASSAIFSKGTDPNHVRHRRTAAARCSLVSARSQYQRQEVCGRGERAEGRRTSGLFERESGRKKERERISEVSGETECIDKPWQ